MQYYTMYMCSLIQNQWGICYHGNCQTSLHLVPLPLFTFKKPTIVFVNKKKTTKISWKYLFQKKLGKLGKNLRKQVLYSQHNVTSLYLRYIGELQMTVSESKITVKFLTAATDLLKVNPDLFFFFIIQSLFWHVKYNR